MSLFVVLNELAELYMLQPNCITLAAGMPNAATYPINNISMTYKYDISVNFSEREVSTALQYGAARG